MPAQVWGCVTELQRGVTATLTRASCARGTGGDRHCVARLPTGAPGPTAPCSCRHCLVLHPKNHSHGLPQNLRHCRGLHWKVVVRVLKDKSQDLQNEDVGGCSVCHRDAWGEEKQSLCWNSWPSFSGCFFVLLAFALGLHSLFVCCV